MGVRAKIFICLILIFAVWFGCQIYNVSNYIPCCGDDLIYEDGNKVCSCKFSNESGFYSKFSMGCTNCSNCSWSDIFNVSKENWINYSMMDCKE